MKKEKRTIICRHCGTAVDAHAPVCPACGADSETGLADKAGVVDSPAKTPLTLRPGFRYVLAGTAVLLVSALLVIGLPWGAWLVPVWIGAAILVMWKTRPHAEKEKSMERRLEKELTGMLAGDRAQAARLIAYEQNRSPHLTRLQCIDNALYHLKRDRR